MNRKHTLFWLATAWALLGLAVAGSALEMKLDGKAMVRTVHGTVQYAKGDQWPAVKAKMEFGPGATFRTGPESFVDLWVNGISTIRATALTTMQLQRMARVGADRNADTETTLDLQSGTILGNVKKLSAISYYRIKTPHGTAGIRGTDFAVQVMPLPTGGYTVTFTCVTGEMVCAFVVDGAPKVLHSGKSWTLGGLDVTSAGSAGMRETTWTTSRQAPILSREEWQVVYKIAADYNSFGFQLLKATSKLNPSANVFLSPLGAAFALSIARSGARGATEGEMTRALRLDNLPPSAIDEANKNMLGQLPTSGGDLKLEIANGLWIQKKAGIKPDFVTNAHDFYNAEAASVDLHGSAAIDAINDWVNDHTHGTIPSMIGGLDPQTVMVVVDAVYFKGLWDVPFDKALTREKPFMLVRGGRISHPRMQRSGSFDYYETHSFQLVALPYEGAATMYVLLPKGSLESFIQRLTAEDWEKWISNLKDRQGLLELPRFKLDNDYALNKPLQALGIRLAFEEERANFDGIADPPLWVSEMQQKTHVDVNEEGTEASAVTFVPMTLGIETPHKEPPPFEMIVDHPFFVVIRENATGAMLFMGAIRGPR